MVRYATQDAPLTATDRSHDRLREAKGAPTGQVQKGRRAGTISPEHVLAPVVYMCATAKGYPVNHIHLQSCAKYLYEHTVEFWPMDSRRLQFLTSVTVRCSIPRLKWHRIPATTATFTRTRIVLCMSDQAGLAAIQENDPVFVEVELPVVSGLPRRCLACRCVVAAIEGGADGSRLIDLDVKHMAVQPAPAADSTDTYE